MTTKSILATGVLVALVLSCAAAAGKDRKKDKGQPAITSVPAQSSRPDAQVFLDAHNAIRAALKQPPGYPGEWAPLAHLEWSDELADGAQDWADRLRDNKCALLHSDTRLGENLAGGKDMDAVHAVALWASEAPNYRYAPVYDFQRNAGHYTQLVWRKTTHVGCGRATCGKRAVIVCRYSPPGNHIGRDPY